MSRLLDAIESLNVWRRGDQRAPHKPLLLLLLLRRAAVGDPRVVQFSEIEQQLRDLITEFGPPRPARPEYPFWHLQTDGIWEIEDVAELGRRPSQTPPISIVRTLRAGVAHDVWQEMRSDLTRAAAVRSILDSNFPTSMHADILDAVGLEGISVAARHRDRNFRRDVLREYGYRCAVCGYDGKMDAVTVGVEAAHVKWKAAGGPDAVNNGIALCSLHHKVFDFGVIGVSQDGHVKVSNAFHGGRTAEAMISRYAGKLIRIGSRSLIIARPFLDWHDREVFRSPAAQPVAAAAETEPDYSS